MKIKVIEKGFEREYLVVKEAYKERLRLVRMSDQVIMGRTFKDVDEILDMIDKRNDIVFVKCEKISLH